MGLYSQFIFPRLCDFCLNTELVAKHRKELLAQADGQVLEIGFGTGLNLPHYPDRIRRLTVVDPNQGMNRLAQKRIKQRGIEVDQRIQSGENLPFENGQFDCVVSTFTLCSIDEVQQALGEIYRVLRQAGRFLFLEHGLSPDPKVQRWQHRLNWLQMHLAGGCHLNRNIKELVSSQPFSSVKTDKFYLEKSPRTHGYLYKGAAIR